jgi:hypothetical protein
MMTAILFTGGPMCKKDMETTEPTEMKEEKNGSVIKGREEDRHIEGKTTKETIKENKETGVIEYKFYVGSYRLKMSGFTGVLNITFTEGAYQGTIYFENWGNKTPQPLKNLKIREKKIYFIRSITTEEEKIKFGSSRYFQQTYYGLFSDDGMMIRGYYNDSGAENKWEARR